MRAGPGAVCRAACGQPSASRSASHWFLFIVALLCVPVAVYSGFAAWSFLTAGAALLVVPHDDRRIRLRYLADAVQ